MLLAKAGLAAAVTFAAGPVLAVAGPEPVSGYLPGVAGGRFVTDGA